MTDNERSEQMFKAISMSNRLSLAQIKLKWTDRLSDSLGKEIKDIDRGIFSHTDCFLIGDDVRSELESIEMRIEALETGI